MLALDLTHPARPHILKETVDDVAEKQNGAKFADLAPFRRGSPGPHTGSCEVYGRVCDASTPPFLQI